MEDRGQASLGSARWVAAAILSLCLVAAGSACTAGAGGATERESVGSIEQAAAVCGCVVTGVCGYDSCSSTKVPATCTLTRCATGQEHCYVQSDGTSCTTPTGAKSTCRTGICGGTDAYCTGCFLKATCVAGRTAAACGSGGVTCRSCNDNNPCTEDSCDSNGECQNDPITGGECSDGNACTTGGTCVSGVCEGIALDCDNGEPCTKDSCDPDTGKCVSENLEDGTACDDGNACTLDDQCQSGKCTGTGKQCDDGNPCTANACEADNCSFPAARQGEACQNPASLCTVGQVCADGACVGGEPKDCADTNPCTEDSCDSTTGNCLHTPIASSTECSDGNLCTVNDACDENGNCVGEDISCAPLDDCHEAGSCNSETGLCDDPRKADHSECPGGECVSGVCELSATGGAGGEAGAAGSSAAGQAGMGGSAGTAEAGSAGTTQSAGAAGQESSAGSSGNSQAGQAGAAEAGSPSAGQAGSPSAGEAGSSGEGNAPIGKAGSAGKSEAAGEAGQSAASGDELYKRNPGGCSCRVGGQPDADATGSLGLGAVLALLGLWSRRRSPGVQRRAR